MPPDKRVDKYRKRSERRDKKIAVLEEKLYGKEPKLAEYEVVDADWVPQFIEWSAGIIVPTGSPELQGKPFQIFDWQVDILEALADPAKKRIVFSVPRKQGKSMLISLVAIFFLLHGKPFWKAAVASVSAELTGTIKAQMIAVCEVNDIESVLIHRTNPGKAICGNREVKFVASNAKTTGHSLENNLVIFDELGKTTESDRTIVNALIASLASTDGDFFAISPQYASPIMQEFRQLAEVSDRAAYMEYAADVNDDPFAPETWEKANPGLGTIKPYSYMELEAERAKSSVSMLPDFLSQELNLPYAGDKQMICTVEEWLSCLDSTAQLENEPVMLGLDLGGSSSMTAGVAIGLRSCVVKAWGAFADDPDLLVRGRGDGVGLRYDQMRANGELRTYPGRIVPVGQFVDDVIRELAALGCTVHRVGCDRYRMAEMEHALQALGIRPVVAFRGTGASKTADGSHDVRSFQHLVLNGELRYPARSLMMEMAITSCQLRRDPAGNPALERSHSKARIDAVAAAVIACGMYRIYHTETKLKSRSRVSYA